MNSVGAFITVAVGPGQAELPALLSLGQDRAIERVLATYDLAGVKGLCVSLDIESAQLTNLLDYHSVRWVSNRSASPGQLDAASWIVRAAELLMPRLESISPTHRDTGFFVHPASTPLVALDTLRRLEQAYDTARRERGALLAVPCYDEQIGWPWLASPELAALLVNAPQHRAPCEILAFCAERALRVAVPDAATLLETTTPEGFRRVSATARAELAPDRERARRLLLAADQPPRRIAHCHRVAAIGRRLAQEYCDRGLPLDCELAYAAGLLHDVAKGQKGHNLAGARLLRREGFFQTGHIIASHTEIHWRPADGLNETALVYLADKLVKGATLVGVDRRFRYWLDGLGDDPEDRRILTQRLKTARAIENLAAVVLGQPLLDFLQRHVPDPPVAQ